MQSILGGLESLLQVVVVHLKARQAGVEGLDGSREPSDLAPGALERLRPALGRLAGGEQGCPEPAPAWIGVHVDGSDGHELGQRRLETHPDALGAPPVPSQPMDGLEQLLVRVLESPTARRVAQGFR